MKRKREFAVFQIDSGIKKDMKLEMNKSMFVREKRKLSH